MRSNTQKYLKGTGLLLFFIFQKKSKKKWAYALIYVKHHSWWCDQHVYINTKRKAPWYFKDGARGRNRTDTPITGPRILSPVRLPVSPLEHKMVTCKELESLTPWLKVKCSTSWANRSCKWLGYLGSNQRMPESKSGALPLGYIPRCKFFKMVGGDGFEPPNPKE